MRVTHNMLVNTTLRNLGSNAARLNKLQDQMSSTYRISRLSDDPLAMLTSLDSRSKLYAQDQYVKNLDDAESWLTMAEASMMEINNIVKRIYELTIDAATDVKTGDERKAIAHEVKQLQEQLLTSANSTIMEKHLFGGYNGAARPFEVVNGTLYYNGMNMYASTNVNVNVEAFVSKGLDALLGEVDSALATPQLVVEDARRLHDVMETVINAARTVYKDRVLPDPDHPDKIVQQSASVMISAMRQVLDAHPEWGTVGSPEYDIAASVILAAQEGNDGHIIAEGGAMSVLDMMKNLEQLTGNVKRVVDEMDKKIKQGEITNLVDIFDPLEGYLTNEVATAQKRMGDAVTAAGLGIGSLDDEAKKKYEIEVGYGQLLNIKFNGIEIFGVGDNNLYKILDDLHFALTRDYIDTEFGHEGFVYDTVLAMTTPPFLAMSAADYTDATDQLTEVVLAGVNMLGKKYAVTQTYGKEALMESIFSYFNSDPAYTSAATDAAYQSLMTADVSGLTAILNEGILGLADEMKPLSQIISDMGTAISVPAHLQGTVADILDKVQRGVESGMTYKDMKNALTNTLNAMSNLNADVAAVSSGNVADAQAFTQTAYDDAAAALEKVSGNVQSITQDYSIAEIIAKMGQTIDPSWPADVQKAAQDLIIKTESALRAGRTKEEVMTSLWRTKSALSELQAAAPADIPGIVNKAKSDFYTSTNGIKTGSIADDITPFISPLQEKQRDTIAQLTILGGRSNRVKVMQERYALDALNYTERISRVEDLDMAEAMIHYKVANAVYESSLNVGAKIMQLSLIDFMR